MENENQKIEIIGLRKYDYLIEKQKGYNNYNFSNSEQEQKFLSEIELQQIEQYEQKFAKPEIDEEAKKKYMRTVRDGEKREVETISGLIPNYKNLSHGFLQAFELLNAKKYELNPDSILNIKAVVQYFANDEAFFQSERLIKQIDDRELVPSFKKGILIVGDFGNGKSSIMQTFEYLIDHNYKIALDQKWDTVNQWKRLRFKFRSCRTIASEYEYLSKEDSKQVFLNKYSVFDYCFDDITKEQIASNYGLKNVIQVILENRYDDIFVKIKEEKKVNRTHGTINYHKEYPGNLKIAIQALGVKYEPHMYDRALQIFNIIEFKGKSFRK